MMKLFAGFLAALACCVTSADESARRNLTFEERVKAQDSIERVYYAHQIGATTAFEIAVPRSVLERKVRRYLDQTEALEVYWRISVTDEMLQSELERMAHGTRMPERLLELYSALGDDAFVIKECLVRASLVDRLARDAYAFDPTLHEEARLRAEDLLGKLRAGELKPQADVPERSVISFVVDESPRKEPLRRRALRSMTELRARRAQYPGAVGQASPIEEARDGFQFSVVLSESPSAFQVARYTVPKRSWDDWWAQAKTTLQSAPVAAVASDRAPLPFPSKAVSVEGAACPPEDTWTETSLLDAPTPRFLHTAVWTGSLMIVWGGWDEADVNTGGRYDPATDSWTPTSTAGAPSGREFHTAVWTGSLMVVWGGWDGGAEVATGGRYDLVNDSWTPTSATVPTYARESHTAVWTGNRMVVWGGYSFDGALQFPVAGLRYDPTNDSWTPTSTAGAPSARYAHTAVWTGSRMVVWGGDFYDGVDHFVNTGGRYEPSTDAWTSTSTVAAPSPRGAHTALWTGTRMVVWGGDFYDGLDHYTSSGGQYDPTTNSWTPTSTAGAPSARAFHTVVWIGNRMVAWGGDFYDGSDHLLDTGGRYDPTADSWSPTSTTDVPTARWAHTAVSTGESMVVWGGADVDFVYSTGGRYALSTGDTDGDGYSACAGDCDESNASVHPGALETCNGIDDDCDTFIDNGADGFCADGNACTDDVCNGATGCAHVDADCDDANLCTDDSCNPASGCAHTDNSASCTDNKVCTADACDPASGCSTIHKPVNIDMESFSVDRVDGRDLAMLANAWNSCAPDGRYNAAADLDPISAPPGACVDESDFHLLMSAFGQSCQ